MKYAILTARLLLGIIFLVFGANHIVPFLPAIPFPGDAGVFATILFTHKYFAVIGLIQVISGLLLLVGRFVPLALTLLGPIVVNIFLFTVLIAGGNLVLPILVIVPEVFLLVAYSPAFRTLFHPNAEHLGSAVR